MNRKGTAEAGSFATSNEAEVRDRGQDRADREQPWGGDDIRGADDRQPDRPDGEAQLHDDCQERQVEQADGPLLAQDRRHGRRGE
jgi:hypothetical protein